MEKLLKLQDKTSIVQILNAKTSKSGLEIQKMVYMLKVQRLLKEP
jgi:hypothetical protein